MRIRQGKDKYNIGVNIRDIRMKNNLTQEETVAKMQLLGLEISRGTYSQIECGIANPRVEDILALQAIFHVSIEDFFCGLSL